MEQAEQPIEHYIDWASGLSSQLLNCTLRELGGSGPRSFTTIQNFPAVDNITDATPAARLSGPITR